VPSRKDGGEVPDYIARANAYRARAKSLRAIADGTAEKMAREALFIVADDYERMAMIIETKLREHSNVRPSSN
jgi:hypothetical protein